jgi:hypothetical protein
MLGSRFSRLVHASLAGGSLVLAGCVSRAYDFDGDGSGGESESGTESTTDPTVGSVTNPTSPPTTVGPTTDPTDPTAPPPPPPELPGPPKLIAADLIDNLTLALTFSEGLSPPSSVDPTQFRLSAAYAPKGNYYYQYNTYYQEVGNWNGACEEYCYQYCYGNGCYEQCWDYCQPGPPVRVTAIAQLPDRIDVLLLSLDNGIGHGVCSQLDAFPRQWTKGLFIHYTPDGTAPVTDTQGEALADIGEIWALQPNRQWMYNQGTFPFLDPVLPIPCPF